MRIATWNVNSVRTRLKQVLRWLAEEQPDLLCLQETKVEDRLFPRDAFSEAGYEATVSGQKSYNGVAILSRQKLEDVRIGFDGWLEDDLEAVAMSEQKRVISARLGSLRIANVYVPNGASVGSEKYRYKLSWLECLGRYVSSLLEAGDPLCLVGDFNIALEDRDIHDPQRFRGHIMASDAEREALATVLGTDLQDAFRIFEAASGHWSWWDYRTRAWERDRGWRIDHVYLSAELQARASQCCIHKQQRGCDQPSDHAPVMVEL